MALGRDLQVSPQVLPLSSDQQQLRARTPDITSVPQAENLPWHSQTLAEAVLNE